MSRAMSKSWVSPGKICLRLLDKVMHSARRTVGFKM